jgi:cytochrome c6
VTWATDHIYQEVHYCNTFGCILVAMLQRNSYWSLKMKRIDFKVSFATALAVVLSLPLPAHAQSAADLFKSKCARCHAADGTGSAMGKKMGAHDFTTAEVQGMSDAQLTDIITNGKNKMPKYGSLKPEDIKGLVAYIRTLKK